MKKFFTFIFLVGCTSYSREKQDKKVFRKNNNQPKEILETNLKLKIKNFIEKIREDYANYEEKIENFSIDLSSKGFNCDDGSNFEIINRILNLFYKEIFSIFQEETFNFEEIGIVLGKLIKLSYEESLNNSLPGKLTASHSMLKEDINRIKNFFIDIFESGNSPLSIYFSLLHYIPNLSLEFRNNFLKSLLEKDFENLESLFLILDSKLINNLEINNINFNHPIKVFYPEDNKIIESFEDMEKDAIYRPIIDPDFINKVCTSKARKLASFVEEKEKKFKILKKELIKILYNEEEMKPHIVSIKSLIQNLIQKISTDFKNKVINCYSDEDRSKFAKELDQFLEKKYKELINFNLRVFSDNEAQLIKVADLIKKFLIELINSHCHPVSIYVGNRHSFPETLDPSFKSKLFDLIVKKDIYNIYSLIFQEQKSMMLRTIFRAEIFIREKELRIKLGKNETFYTLSDIINDKISNEKVRFTTKDWVNIFIEIEDSKMLVEEIYVKLEKIN